MTKATSGQSNGRNLERWIMTTSVCAVIAIVGAVAATVYARQDIAAQERTALATEYAAFKGEVGARLNRIEADTREIKADVKTLLRPN